MEVTSTDAWNTDHARAEVMNVIEAFREYGDTESIRVYDGELICQYVDTDRTEQRQAFWLELGGGSHDGQ